MPHEQTPRLGSWRKLVRYSGTSVVALALSQTGLSVAYGGYHTTVVVAVAVALAVSIIPAYLLNRRFVWSAASTPAARRRQLSAFVLIAVIGSSITALVGSGTEQLARRLISGHLALTVVINVSAVFTTVVIWLVRFVVLDRFVFRPVIPNVEPAV